jgi:hypothetical protein
MTRTRDGGRNMTGPEHYLEAERLLDSLYGVERGSLPGEASIAAEAQVHATLALAAATALSGLYERAWRDVAAPEAG